MYLTEALSFSRGRLHHGQMSLGLAVDVLPDSEVPLEVTLHQTCRNTPASPWPCLLQRHVKGEGNTPVWYLRQSCGGQSSNPSFPSRPAGSQLLSDAERRPERRRRRSGGLPGLKPDSLRTCNHCRQNNSTQSELGRSADKEKRSFKPHLLTPSSRLRAGISTSFEEECRSL